MNLVVQIQAGTPGIDLISSDDAVKFLESIIKDIKQNGMMKPGESLKIKDEIGNVIVVCELVQAK